MPIVYIYLTAGGMIRESASHLQSRVSRDVELDYLGLEREICTTFAECFEHICAEHLICKLKTKHS